MNYKIPCIFNDRGAWCKNTNVGKSLLGFGARVCKIGPDKVFARYLEHCEYFKPIPVPTNPPRWKLKPLDAEHKGEGGSMKALEDIGVVVGRFQLDSLHEGHIKLLDTANKHSRLIIVIGLSHGKCTVNNPLDFQSRKEMLQDIYPNATIFYVKDIHDNDLWSQDLDERILDIVGPEQTVMLYGSRDSFIPYYHGQFPTSEIEPDVQISATEIRKRLASAITNSRDWRAGACWAMANQWPKPMFTIDVAIMSGDGKKILLGRKKRETKYRFIGGFVGNQESLEATVVREAYEEAGVNLRDIKYVASCPIDDWRYRSEKDKITTAFFIAKMDVGSTPVAGDDIHEVRWFNVDEIFANEEEYINSDMSELVTNHKILMKYLLDFLGK